ncbi:uncharacterized protein LOC131226196 isoform X2 [Magnolia sinica]|uniref:uncharacterized protein LOC131226196 isoform X2 n=1 Tax=Magnolia sinica TaxID=86752 RepID=UPI002658374B|nr:uncharacterized protein LOC131226196 isoform X2 [Magnolia sinica]
MSHEEAALSAPPHVTDDDWRILCDRFSSDSFQRDSVTGQESGPVDLYKGTHCRQATGSWVHPRAGEIWAAMDTLRNQSTPDGTQRSEPEILSEVLGTRSGYVCGLGHGAKLMAPARAASTRSIVVGESATRRVDIAEKEVQQLRVVVHDIREQLER